MIGRSARRSSKSFVDWASSHWTAEPTLVGRLLLATGTVTELPSPFAMLRKAHIARAVPSSESSSPTVSAPAVSVPREWTFHGWSIVLGVAILPMSAPRNSRCRLARPRSPSGSE